MFPVALPLLLPVSLLSLLPRILPSLFPGTLLPLFPEVLRFLFSGIFRLPDVNVLWTGFPGILPGFIRTAAGLFLICAFLAVFSTRFFPAVMPVPVPPVLTAF